MAPRMKRRALVLLCVVGLLAAGTAGLALRFTVFFDAQRYWWRLLHSGPPVADRRRTLAARHHRAPTPCLRYPPTTVDDTQELDAVAAKLIAAGLVEQVGKAMLLSRVWELTEENGAHALGPADEVLDLMTERAGALDRLVISLHRDELIRVADLNMPSGLLVSMQRDAEAALTTDQIAELRRIWEQHKVALSRAEAMPQRVRRRATEKPIEAPEAPGAPEAPR